MENTEDIKTETLEVPEVEEKENKKEKKLKKEKVDKEKELLKAQNEELGDRLLRISAEYQNVKRRYEEQISNMYKYDGEDVIKKLLPIVDNFERAILMDTEDLTDELSKFLSGFKMIYTSLVDILKNKGVEEMPIELRTTDFDPNLMQAVLTDHIDGVEVGKVIEVLQKGYIYNGKVIRYAMVKVNE